MNETYMVNSGTLESYNDGKQINNIKYKAESDGDTVDFYIKDNNEEYYGQATLNEDSRLDLLNYPSSKMLLLDTLEKDFPINKTSITKSKSKSKSKSKKRGHSRSSSKKKKD
jgi:hypothetical protein